MNPIQQIRSVADYLEKPGDAWNPNTYRFAPEIRAQAPLLREAADALEQSVTPSLRPDVLQFARQMSEVMQKKEGICETPEKVVGALIQIQNQWQKFEQVPQPNREQTKRILTHIANWACIATRMLEEGKEWQ